MAIRLNKFLADRGVAARRKCDELIAEGRVSVNGHVVREVGTKVEERDKVAVNGRPVGGRERHVYYVLNKPVGVITTLDDPEGRRSIREFMPRGARVYPVGRLDADTSGLLLLTNDGELAHRLMHPRYGVAKVYRVRLGREPRPDQLRRLGSGVRFEAGQVSGPARVRRIDPGFDAIMIEVTIHEGRFRQVRKMCETVGLEVTGLHRVGYGPLRLGPMTRGMFRELSAEEVAALQAASTRATPRRGATSGETKTKEGERPVRRERPEATRPRAERAAPPPVVEVEEEEAEDDEREETWVAGGGVLEPEGMDDATDDSDAPASSWPSRPSSRRGDRDWKPGAAAAPPPTTRAREARERPASGRAAPRGGARERGPRTPEPRERRAIPAEARERRARVPSSDRRPAAPRARATTFEPRERRRGPESRERRPVAPKGRATRRKAERRGPPPEFARFDRRPRDEREGRARAFEPREPGRGGRRPTERPGRPRDFEWRGERARPAERPTPSGRRSGGRSPSNGRPARDAGRPARDAGRPVRPGARTGGGRPGARSGGGRPARAGGGGRPARAGGGRPASGRTGAGRTFARATRNPSRRKRS